MSVKWNILLMAAIGILAGANPVYADHAGNVVGLVNLTNYQAALLVITDSPPEASFVSGTHKWVVEGDNFDDLNLKEKRLQIEILRIDFTNGAVRVKENGVATFYVPEPTNLVEATAGKGIMLKQVDFGDALDLYASLKNRTLLIHPDLKQPLLTLSVAVTNPTVAIGTVKRSLEERGAAIIPDGNRFEWIVPAGATNLFSPAAIPARAAPKSTSTTNGVETLPAVSINFINVDLQQVLAVYQALTAQKWVQGGPLPVGATFTFHNQTPLTKTEVLHAFDVILAWRGLKVVNLDDKSFKLAPLASGG